MRKLFVVARITVLLTFLGLFIYFYKSSGKFRQSIIAAFVAVSFYFSGLKPTHSIDQAEGFSPKLPQHSNRPQNEGIFTRNRNGSGPGKPNGGGSGGDDGGIPNYPQSESVDETQKRVESMREHVRKLEEDTDSEEDQCDQQNKGGINELPDSSEFIYKLETKIARKALKKVWKNPEAKKEVLAGLKRINTGELLPRHQKYFRGFKTLKEIKLRTTRMLIQQGQNGGPDQIVAIFMRSDMDDIVSTFKKKYK